MNMKDNRRFTVIIIVLFLFFTILSCSSSTGKIADIVGKSSAPDVDDYNAIPPSVVKALQSSVEEITPEQEYTIGQDISAKILESYKIWNGKPALTEYLNRICMALVIKSPKPDLFNGYVVSILDSNESKAFAVPGGHIYLTRGLINSAKSENDLALMIAREIARLQLRHPVKELKNARITRALVVAGSIQVAGTETNINDLSSAMEEVVNEIVQRVLSDYSREQQKEAEDYAKKILDSAGYNAKQNTTTKHAKDYRQERFAAAMR